MWSLSEVYCMLINNKMNLAGHMVSVSMPHERNNFRRNGNLEIA